MVKVVENKSKRDNTSTKIVKQVKIWPLAFQQVVQDQKTFPKSWSAFPVRGRFS